MSFSLIFRAQSGTGKTATFSISILQCLDLQVSNYLSVIIMAALGTCIIFCLFRYSN